MPSHPYLCPAGYKLGETLLGLVIPWSDSKLVESTTLTIRVLLYEIQIRNSQMMRHTGQDLWNVRHQGCTAFTLSSHGIWIQLSSSTSVYSPNRKAPQSLAVRFLLGFPYVGKLGEVSVYMTAFRFHPLPLPGGQAGPKFPVLTGLVFLVIIYLGTLPKSPHSHNLRNSKCFEALCKKQSEKDKIYYLLYHTSLYHT